MVAGGEACNLLFSVIFLDFAAKRCYFVSPVFRNATP
jgi:hypothetical protein